MERVTDARYVTVFEKRNGEKQTKIKMLLSLPVNDPVKEPLPLYGLTTHVSSSFTENGIGSRKLPVSNTQSTTSYPFEEPTYVDFTHTRIYA
jgi:hypothetical protein